ncbi:MAG: hypothetical protein ACK4GM_01545 [Tabrizicola sp.]
MFLAHQQTRLGFLRLAWRLVQRRVDHGRDLIVSTPRRIAIAVRGRWRIAVMHHAPVPAADGTAADMASRAQALAALARAGVDLVPSGHSHMPHMGLADTATGVLFLQVGTALSTRLKTGSNDLTLLGLSPGVVTVESWLSPSGTRSFDPSPGQT